MFYLGNFLIFFAFNLMAQPLDLVSRYGMQPPLFLSLFWSTFMLGLGFSLAYCGSSEAHRRHPAYSKLGVIMIVVALIGFSNVQTHIYPSDLALMAAYLVPGMLLYSYNKKAKPLPRPVEQLPREEVVTVTVKPVSEFDQVLMKFKEAEHTNFARRNPTFMERLTTSETFLNELHKNGYTIDAHILKQINEILSIYLDLQGQIIQTPRLQNLLETVVCSFDMIQKSLESMYDKSFEQRALGIESDIKSLELKLRSEGLLGSDFDLNK